MKEKLYTTRDIAHILNIPDKDIIDAANDNCIPHLKVAGEFLRFRKEDVNEIKEYFLVKPETVPHKYSFLNRVQEFFYFHDFHIVCTVVVIVLIWLIISDLPL